MPQQEPMALRACQTMYVKETEVCKFLPQTLCNIWKKTMHIQNYSAKISSWLSQSYFRIMWRLLGKLIQVTRKWRPQSPCLCCIIYIIVLIMFDFPHFCVTVSHQSNTTQAWMLCWMIFMTQFSFHLHFSIIKYLLLYSSFPNLTRHILFSFYCCLFQCPLIHLTVMKFSRQSEFIFCNALVNISFTIASVNGFPLVFADKTDNNYVRIYILIMCDKVSHHDHFITYSYTTPTYFTL